MSSLISLLRGVASAPPSLFPCYEPSIGFSPWGQRASHANRVEWAIVIAQSYQGHYLDPVLKISIMVY